LPKSKIQKVIFSLLMALLMVYGMETYNHLIADSRHPFVIPIPELVGLISLVILLQELIGGPAARKIAFKVVNPRGTRPIKVIVAVQIATVCLMCPMMSLAATAIFKANIDAPLLGKWLTTFAANFPMAMFWQLLIAGPIVRWVVNMIPESSNTAARGS
jgi:hypothetical protein